MRTDYWGWQEWWIYSPQRIFNSTWFWKNESISKGSKFYCTSHLLWNILELERILEFYMGNYHYRNIVVPIIFSAMFSAWFPSSSYCTKSLLQRILKSVGFESGPYVYCGVMALWLWGTWAENGPLFVLLFPLNPNHPLKTGYPLHLLNSSSNEDFGGTG